jgi:hypothetical protein
MEKDGAMTTANEQSESLLAGFVDRETLAEMLRCSPRTLARYEALPDGLPFMTLAGRRLYRLSAVREWLAARERRPNPRRRA